MKISLVFTSTTSLLAFLAICPSMNGQGTLQNLNFEQAHPGPLTGDPPSAANVPVTSALPSWSVFYGSVRQSYINVNAPSTGAPAVTLIAPGGGPIDGNYSVLLQASGPGVSISQSSTIPSGTQTLFFEAQPGFGSLNVLIGTQIVPIVAVGSGTDYTLYGANVSAWAGSPELLTFSALGDLSQPNNWELDDISFSAVPEPGIVALTAIGGLLFSARKWFARR